MQHGEAKPEMEDPQRPLTDKGREEVALMARCASEMGIKVSRIVHSGRLRAKQTAEILAQYLSPAYGLEERQGLAPLDSPEEAKAFVQEAAEPLMLVGHLPHLSRLASALILDEPEREIIRFRMGGIVCLIKAEKAWAVGWALTPEAVKGVRR